MPKYRVLRGLSFPPGKRAEPGEIRDDIPPESVPWLIRRGAVEPVVTVTRPTPARKEA